MIYPTITVWQPSLADMCRPYLAGTLHGDAWCTPLSLGLRVKDHDFALSFSHALYAATDRSVLPRLDERGYWLVRKSNKRGQFDNLKDYDPRDNDEIGWWLRGLFDSEGNAQITSVKGRAASFSRRIAIYSTNHDTLYRASKFMEWLEIPCGIRATQNSASHIGSKPVFELRVLRQAGFCRFMEMVGSSILRKESIIQQIVGTYQPPGWQARNWQKAVAARWPR